MTSEHLEILRRAMADFLCECCSQREAVGVCNATWGAMSFRYCLTCLNNSAELPGVLYAGWENGRDISGFTVFNAGRYIPATNLIPAWEALK